MKTLVQGKPPENFWPWNLRLRCYRCGWEGQPEKGVDEGHIGTKDYEDGPQWDPYTVTKRVFRIACPCCGQAIENVEKG